jgi:hypothetical protein
MNYFRQQQDAPPHILDANSFPFFENKSPAVNRKITQELQTSIFQFLIRNGMAEPEIQASPPAASVSRHQLSSSAATATTSRLRIISKPVESVASDILQWAGANFAVGNIFTVYELLRQDDGDGSGSHGSAPFANADPVIFHRALLLLQAQQKVNECLT